MTLQFNEPHVSGCNHSDTHAVQAVWDALRFTGTVLLHRRGFGNVQALNTLCNIISMSSQRLSWNSFEITDETESVN